jgi:hypothetical protein
MTIYRLICFRADLLYIKEVFDHAPAMGRTTWFSDQMIRAALLIQRDTINLTTPTRFPDMMAALEHMKTLSEPSIENPFINSQNEIALVLHGNVDILKQSNRVSDHQDSSNRS